MNRIEVTITEEMQSKYGGRGGSCDHFYECNSAGLSSICDLEKGYVCPDCPVRIQFKKDEIEEMKNDPQVMKRFPDFCEKQEE